WPCRSPRWRSARRSWRSRPERCACTWGARSPQTRPRAGATTSSKAASSCSATGPSRGTARARSRASSAVTSAARPSGRARRRTPVSARARELAAVGALTAAALALFFAAPTYPNYDAYYHLDWGREILHGHAPSFEAYKAPTEHPLYVALGALLALLGSGAD